MRGGFLYTNFIINNIRLSCNQAVINLGDIRQCSLEIRHRPYLIWNNCNYHQKRNKSTKEQISAVSKLKESSQLEIRQKVKQATKDVSYLGVIVAGIGITAIMFYAIFRELFSGHSPNVVYGKTLTRCKEDSRIIDVCGEPIKGYGETTARGRRRHVSHLEYMKDGVNHMRMKFYIEGSKRKGTVHLEVKEDENGKYNYRYLFVDLDGYPKHTIVLEDNRYLEKQMVTI